MGKVLRTMALAGSFALAAGASTTGVLAQEDEAVGVGPAAPVSAEESTTVPVIEGSSVLSAEELAQAILADVLRRVELPASGVLDVNEPADNAINIGSSDEIMVGGDIGSDVTLGGGAMPAPAPEAPATEAPAPEAPAAPMSDGTGSADLGY